jgi:hypothetical protein
MAGGGTQETIRILDNSVARKKTATSPTQQFYPGAQEL